jgi:para-aminobenzoate synthetase component 1
METVSTPPLDLFHRLKEKPYAFWLDSAGGPAATMEWSFLGAEPFLRLEARAERIRIESVGEVRQYEGNPLGMLDRLLRRLALPPGPGHPPFIGGAVGWFGYDLARYYERIPVLSNNDTRLPELRLAFYDTVFAFHHPSERMWRVRRTDLADGGLGGELLPEGGLTVSPGTSEAPDRHLELPEATFTYTEFEGAVLRVQEYIKAGDIYQANLTQRFARRLKRPPVETYLRLREVNPAPFAAYLGFGEVRVMSASPERFLSLDAVSRRVETRPIKGTRPRSPDPGRDRALAESLLKSEKDRAENLMIVDVHRNDLGRVCEIGSVRVPILWGLESYATVHHLVSVVQGRLSEERSPVDLLRAAFPAGSITGAPKLRAMEIIEELEPVRRGVYTGALGYIGWDGGMDLSVAIRTLVAQDGGAHYGVGGGIVADSVPAAEYQETLDKARGLERALDA